MATPYIGVKFKIGRSEVRGAAIIERDPEPAHQRRVLYIVHMCVVFQNGFRCKNIYITYR